MIEVKRKVKREIEEVVTMELKKVWCINIVRGVISLSVVNRIEFDHEPTEQEIADALSEYAVNANHFASIVERYELVEVESDQE